ncbi:huntingtin-interacting protein K isoform X2 [Epinephelus lanceolatus]
MAAEGDVDLDLEAEENCTGKPAEKPRKHDSGAADLERVTDYAEEKEISSSDLETAMSVIGDRRSREQKAKQERLARLFRYSWAVMTPRRGYYWNRLLRRLVSRWPPYLTGIH